MCNKYFPRFSIHMWSFFCNFWTLNFTKANKLLLKGTKGGREKKETDTTKKAGNIFCFKGKPPWCS